MIFGGKIGPRTLIRGCFAWCFRDRLKGRKLSFHRAMGKYFSESHPHRHQRRKLSCISELMSIGFTQLGNKNKHKFSTHSAFPRETVRTHVLGNRNWLMAVEAFLVRGMDDEQVITFNLLRQPAIYENWLEVTNFKFEMTTSETNQGKVLLRFCFLGKVASHGIWSLLSAFGERFAQIKRIRVLRL